MDLRESSLGFYRVWLAAVGERHGLLARLTLERTPEALARATRLDATMVRRWCEAARGVGLLRRRGDRYVLPRALAPQLGDPSDPRYLGHHVRYLADKSLGFGQLDALLRGEPVRVDASAAYDEATRWDHLAFFELELPRRRALRAALERGIDVLDLGAGSGGWTREAQRRFPRSRFTAADVDRAALARARGALRGIARVVHASRVPAQAFDLVFLGEVLGAAPEPARALATARRALRPGGQVVLLEGLREEGEPRTWGARLVAAMDFDFALDGSRYLGRAEAVALLGDAGFVRIRARDLGGSLFVLRGDAPVTKVVKRLGGARSSS